MQDLANHNDFDLEGVFRVGPRPGGAELVRALESMGLESVCASSIAPAFADPLIRLAASWEDALAPSTLTARRCDLRRFARWSQERGQDLFASDAQLAGLMQDHIVEVGRMLSAGTARRVGTNLTALAKGVGSDRAARGAQERRKLAVRAATKARRRVGVVHAKPRLTVAQMQAMRNEIARGGSNPAIRARNLAMFDLMCDLMMRRSEVAGLKMRDLDLAAGTVRIAYSKTDQEGRGSVFCISERTRASLEAWILTSDLDVCPVADADALPVFPGVRKCGRVRRGADGRPAPMDGKSVARILGMAAAAVGIDGVAGHSLRRSVARALYEAGVTEDDIVAKGRWSSLDQMRAYVGLTAPIKGAASVLFDTPAGAV